MKRRILTILLTLIVGAAWAARIDQVTAQKAIGNWMKQNGIAKSLFVGASVETVIAYDSEANLWIGKINPHGYVILSGSDLRKPVIAFSERDFEWPEEDSPFAARLNTSAVAIAEAEAVGGVSHEEWSTLFQKVSLKARSVGNSSAIVVEPFMTGTHWSQCQPYNDFSPVYNRSTSTTAYRGRTPCGCVATALAQILAYWKWPVRTDLSHMHNHTFSPQGSGKGAMQTFPIRFDGHSDFDWEALEDQYLYYKYGYDLRGRVAESTRFPVARLILFADHLAKMEFASDGSGAYSYLAASAINPWYENALGVRISENEYSLVADYLKSEMVAHHPVLVSIPGHAIVAHGWAEDGANSHYVYYNYGWGGDNDGWYLVTGGDASEDMVEFFGGIVPRAMVQVDPLPKVVGGTTTLRWHLPDCYVNKVSGFEISKSEVSHTTTSFSDNFNQQKGIFSDSNSSVCGLTTVGWSNRVLFMDPLYENTYTYSAPNFLTSRSQLSFRYMSSYAIDSKLVVQGRFNGGEWMTLWETPLVESGSNSSWQTANLFLGDHGGESVQIQFALVRTGYYYYQNSRYLRIDDVAISNIQTVTTTKQTVSGTLRSAQVVNTAPGSIHVYSVSPIFSTEAGQASSPVQTRMAGVGKVALPTETGAGGNATTGAVLWEEQNFEEEAQPEILTISGSEGFPQVAEGFYRENGLGGNVLWVRCSQSVTTLKAYSSHLGLVADDDIQIDSRGNGEFAIVINANAQKIPNRSRMILTLEAQNGNGTSVYKDLSLRFDSTEANSETYVPRPAVINVETMALSGETVTVSIPYFWFAEKGLVQNDSGVADYVQLALEDSDGDGFSNLAEYICGTNPTDAEDRLVCYIQMVNNEPIVTHSAVNVVPGFQVEVEGTTSLTNPDWQPKAQGHRFFRVVIEQGAQ